MMAEAEWEASEEPLEEDSASPTLTLRPRALVCRGLVGRMNIHYLDVSLQAVECRLEGKSRKRIALLYSVISIKL